MKEEVEIKLARGWFEAKGWRPFPFQIEAWRACLNGKSGLLNAPTGSGKTYALFIGAASVYQREMRLGKKPNGLQLIWITPIRALTKDIKAACEEYCRDNHIPWRVAIRTGDTPTSERTQQRKKPPEVLITTPESLHLVMASKGYDTYLGNLRFIVADEWHELMGSKRAVLMELALSRLKTISKVSIWGISATIGNMDQAREVLLGDQESIDRSVTIKANIHKDVEIVPVIPSEIEKYPWSGHLGVKLAEDILPVINESKTTLIFTNTRAQAEIWYRHLLTAQPDLAGLIAMHHGSISKELRSWVEDALHEGTLKCVVCTSSLDLGVDFRPVETIIQIGSPKGVARFLQRAGRSGHQPGAASKIYFLPTNALQLIECAALKRAISKNDIEDRLPYIRSFDVLVQYLVTLAVSEGFYPKQILKEVRTTYSFSSISEEEWVWALNFITRGGDSLNAYEEFKKVDTREDGLHIVTSRAVAMRHRLSIGAIVSDSMLQVKFRTGGYLGTVEEWFVSRLSPGDAFWFAGKSLELVRIKDMTVQVKKSNKTKAAIPSWQGGRMPLSAMLSENLRIEINEIAKDNLHSKELEAIRPIIDVQKELSAIPSTAELLIETFHSKEGHHVFIYPFEGRLVHEGMAALIGHRLSLFTPISFSIGMNDYGFELLSDQEIPIEDGIDSNIFSTDHLLDDIQSSLNKTELARRRFRDIASIAGLVFRGYPGKPIKQKHLQSSSGLFFDVFDDYDAENLLYRQAYSEVMEFQVEELRLRKALNRISKQKIIIKYTERPTPFAFPILVDRLRGRLTGEKLEDRIKKMKMQLERG